MSQKLSTKSYLAFGALIASSATVAQTADAPKVNSAVLEEMVISSEWLGAPTKQSVEKYTGSRSVVDKEALHERGALNLEDALRSAPGIQVLDETGTGILPNIGVRGLNPLRSERVQLLVDGYPIAIGPYSNIGVSLFPVTLPSLEAIDIVRGGAAVHFGPNNVGGVLNLVTRPISGELSQTFKERITIAEETGNVFTDTYYRAGGFVTDKLGLQLQANVQRGDGFRDHSDTEVNNFIVDGRYFINDHHDLAMQLQYYDVDADLPGALSPSAYYEDRVQSQRPHDGYEADMMRGTVTWTFNPNDNVQFQWRNFAHDADRAFYFGQRLGTEDHWADPSLPSTHVADSPRMFKVYGTEPRVTFNLGNHTLIAGARYVTEDVQFDVNRLEFATDTYSAARDWALETDAYALYVSDTMQFLDGRLEITPGVRYENVDMDFTDQKSGSISENSADEVLPGLTVGLQANDTVFLFANAQKSLVPVQIAQATKEGDVANETAWNYELGSRFSVTNDLSLTTTLFRIDYEDQIQFNKALNTFENLGSTRHQGVELESNWSLSNLVLGLGYTFLDTEQRSGANAGNDLPNAPRHHIKADAAYVFGHWNTSLTGLYASRSFSDAANTTQETANGSAGELPSYVLINARLAREIPLEQDKTLNLALSVNNLLDDEYYFRGVDVSPVGRVPAPGRSYMIEAQLDF